MATFFRSMELEGRAGTVPCYKKGLTRYAQWLAAHALEPLKVTEDDLLEFQKFLAQAYRKPNGAPLSKGTQVTWLSSIKAYYGWLHRRGLLPCDPSHGLKLPKIRRAKIGKEYLTQQEATALLQTQAARVAREKKRTPAWAIEWRNLAMLSLALATGRRCHSIRDLKAAHLDFERDEIRVEWEKGHPGRVLPCAAWAMKMARLYLQEARPLLRARRREPDAGWLFTGIRTERVCLEYLGRMLRQVQHGAIAEHPDLPELRAKRLSSHSLRVTFATLMFLNGAGVRIVNELLMHKQLGTTALYTPLKFEDLRRMTRAAHPRA